MEDEGRWLERRRPHLAVGLAWFLLMVYPALGFVRASTLTRADRFTSLPSIGLAVALAWGLGEVATWASLGRLTRGAAVAVTIVALGIMTCTIRNNWRDDGALFEYALALFKVGGLTEVEGRLKIALALRPGYAEAAGNLRFVQEARARK